MQLAVSGFVSTPEIEGVGDISLNVDPYRIESGSGPGALAWARRTVTSPYVHGETLVGARKEQITMNLRIRIYGDNPSQLQANTAALLRAFEQFRYRVGLTIDDVDWEWYCGPADYSVSGDGAFDKIFLMQPRPHQLYNFQIPRDPTPIQGAY